VLAQAAVDDNLPFILSTCSTASIERIGEITGDDFWFQLYNPVDPAMRNDILDRAGYSISAARHGNQSGRQTGSYSGRQS